MKLLFFFYGAADSDSFCLLSYTIIVTSSVANFLKTIFRIKESSRQINNWEKFEFADVPGPQHTLQTHFIRYCASVREENPVRLKAGEVLNQCMTNASEISHKGLHQQRGHQGAQPVPLCSIQLSTHCPSTPCDRYLKKSRQCILQKRATFSHCFFPDFI